MPGNVTKIKVSSDDLPFLEGHFPGFPLVPGAVLLSWMLDACSPSPEASLPKTIQRAKFLQPVRPGDEIEIVAEPNGTLMNVTARSAADASVYAHATIALA